jgi:hypothetical protein
LTAAQHPPTGPARARDAEGQARPRPGSRLEGRWSTLVIKGDDYRDETFTFRRDGTFAFDETPARNFGAPAP